MSKASMETLCRICLSHSYLHSNIYVCNSTDNNPIYETINYVYDLQISLDDGLPQFICEDCLSMVREFKMYKKNAQKARTELILLKQKIKNISDGAAEGKEVSFENLEDTMESELFMKEEDSVDIDSDDKDDDDDDDEETVEPPMFIKEEFGDQAILFDSEFISGKHTGVLGPQGIVEALLGDGVQAPRLRSSKSFSCPVCSKVYNRRSRLETHKLSHTGERPFACTDCGKTFREKSKLNRHLKLHTGEMHHCVDCGARFAEKGAMLKHQAIHKQQKCFECCDCGKRFYKKSRLEAHEMMHRGEKPHECSDCPKTFSRKEDLIAHKREHTGEKIFWCLECGKTFTRERKLRSHELIHTGEKPFECLICGKRFNRKDNLTTHTRVHSMEQPYECTFCGKRYRYRNCLTKHQVIHNSNVQFD